MPPASQQSNIYGLVTYPRKLPKFPTMLWIFPVLELLMNTQEPIGNPIYPPVSILVTLIVPLKLQSVNLVESPRPIKPAVSLIPEILYDILLQLYNYADSAIPANPPVLFALLIITELHEFITYNEWVIFPIKPPNVFSVVIFPVIVQLMILD